MYNIFIINMHKLTGIYIYIQVYSNLIVMFKSELPGKITFFYNTFPQRAKIVM